MAHTDPSQTLKTLTHIYVRDAQKGFVRPCWAAGTELYCGMCMRGKVESVVGAVCPICSSTVERVLHVAPGGATKPVRRRKNCLSGEGPQCPEASSGGLLDPRHSRKNRA
jgi:hypothetical protein